jgi:hypothetical protein
MNDQDDLTNQQEKFVVLLFSNYFIKCLELLLKFIQKIKDVENLIIFLMTKGIHIIEYNLSILHRYS